MRYFSSASVAASSSGCPAPANSGCFAIAVSISSKNACTRRASASASGGRARRSFMKLRCCEWARGEGRGVWGKGTRRLGAGWRRPLAGRHRQLPPHGCQPPSHHSPGCALPPPSRVDAPHEVLRLVAVHYLQEAAERQRRGRAAAVLHRVARGARGAPRAARRACERRAPGPARPRAGSAHPGARPLAFSGPWTPPGAAAGPGSRARKVLGKLSADLGTWVCLLGIGTVQDVGRVRSGAARVAGPPRGRGFWVFFDGRAAEGRPPRFPGSQRAAHRLAHVNQHRLATNPWRGPRARDQRLRRARARYSRPTPCGGPDLPPQQP
jgi:hypothetical protein